MTGSRPRTRFVPTLTEVVRPPDGSEAPPGADSGEAALPSPVLASEAVAPPPPQAPPPMPSRSMLESAVDDLMPLAREEMRQRLHTAAYALAEEQLRAMEESLRQQLRNALREAAGMGRKP